ncbi:Ubiquitin carboxyl-terminal hydrolase 20 [Lunasporangiospora selenospora]|uniref:Ubiquitin carboxyl-terminal hydrolase 20 n=1 Tax=Lunasporangiospora selenospora TaxID=979761 RepID=A0A9P6KFL2_9FUNG|nr:Ubiquitin carboxyl-terminal hydrolase 20 [Lunasporangiospora selenospora]
MWSGKSAIYSPSHFVSDVKKYNEVFQGSAQQDSQEFIRCILDKLHDELTYPRRAEISTLEIPNAYITLLDERPSVNGVNKTKAIPPNASDSPPIGTTKTSKESERSNGSKGSDSGGGSGGGSGGATSSISYTSSRSSTSSRSAISSENSSLTENSTAPEVTPARVTAPSIISDIFEGTLQSRVRCLICRKEYIKEDKFFDLSIPIDKKSKIIDDVPNDMSGGVKDKDSGMFGSFVESIGGWLSMGNRTIKLQDCLASFCATEELTGEDRYRCTNCDALNDCRKTLRVTQLPETLCIHLKRFKYDTYPSKINTFVQFPMEDLDMTPYFKSSDPNELRNAKYDLYAMVRHRGVVGGGHYIGYAKHTMDSQWYEYDDTYVTRKSSADIAKLEAYILFYKRKSTHRDDDRTRISRYLTGPTMQICDKSLLVYISRLWFCRWNFLTNQEECELNERRRREDDDVTRLDSNIIADGQLWYLIGADWLKEWHAFKAGDRPPGPIRNSQFLKDNGQPRAGMKRGTDYRGINCSVWKYLHGIYGGGPEFVRASLAKPSYPSSSQPPPKPPPSSSPQLSTTNPLFQSYQR